MKACVLLVCVVLCLGIVPVQAQDSNPYIYYFDSFRNAFIVERADGTNTRVFGQEVLALDQYVPDPGPAVNGPGWSPDGRWFTFARGGEGRPDAFVLRLDGSEYTLEPWVVFGRYADRADAIEYMWDVMDMHWSPDSRYLLVQGHPQPPPDSTSLYEDTAYWLIELESNHVIGLFDYQRGFGSPSFTPIDWDLEVGSVTFFVQESDLGNHPGIYSQVTMHFDGTIVKISGSKNGMLPIDVPLFTITTTILSPSGRFRITGDNQLIDDQLQITIDLPQPDFGDRWEEFRPYYTLVAAWDATESWVIIGYSTYSNVVGGLAIVRSDGTGFRTLSAATCLEWNPGNACVGWLPDNVDVESIPLLFEAP